MVDEWTYESPSATRPLLLLIEGRASNLRVRVAGAGAERGQRGAGAAAAAAGADVFLLFLLFLLFLCLSLL